MYGEYSVFFKMTIIFGTQFTIRRRFVVVLGIPNENSTRTRTVRCQLFIKYMFDSLDVLLIIFE